MSISPVLRWALLADAVATAATGLSTGLVMFVLFQLVATIFLTAELALAQVVIAEEFPAAARGRGQGSLGAFAALGAGVAKLDGANDRAVAVDAPHRSRPVKTANCEQLADDEVMGLFKAHLFGRRLSSHAETNQQKCRTRQHPVPLSQSAH